MGMLQQRYRRGLATYERFLRLDQLTSTADILRARAVYVIAWTFALMQIANLGLMTVSYGGWTFDHNLSVIATVLILSTGHLLRYTKTFSLFTMLMSFLMFAGIASSAVPDGTGINTALLPMVVIGVLIAGFVSSWQWVWVYVTAAIAFILALYVATDMSAYASALTAEHFATVAQQRAIQACLVVMIAGAVVALFSVNLDRLFTDLERTVLQARAGESAKSNFLANMSHELRTPLNGVIGMSQLLLRTELTDTQRQYAEIVNDCSTGLVTIINDVLDISKLDAGRVELTPASFDLRAMLASLISLHRPSALAKSLALALEIEGDMPARFLADESRLRQVVNNLLGNAVKFTETGAVILRAEIRPLDDRHSRVSIYVQDTGVGIPPEHQARVFDRFEQVDSTMTTKSKGTGLGLAISRELVRVFGGELKLASRPGRGTTFAFCIALQVDRRADAPQSGAQQAGLPQAGVLQADTALADTAQTPNASTVRLAS